MSDDKQNPISDAPAHIEAEPALSGASAETVAQTGRAAKPKPTIKTKPALKSLDVPPSAPQKVKSPEKKERLALALRENLRRRKAQARERSGS